MPVNNDVARRLRDKARLATALKPLSAGEGELLRLNELRSTRARGVVANDNNGKGVRRV